MRRSTGIFEQYADIYRGRGFWPRPVILGDKRPPMKRWEVPDPDVDPAELASWPDRHGHLGIGLLMGSIFPDGSRLAAIDVDDDRFVPLAEALLFGPLYARVGARGIAFFVRVTAEKPARVFNIKTAAGEAIHVGELLGDGVFCVIPPTIHPNGNAYRWVGKSLLDIDYSELPLIED